MTAIREALQELIHCMDLSAAGQPVYERWKHAVNNARAALSQEVPQPDDETTWTADYRAGYEAAVAACCALGWKTPQEVPQEPVADPKARAIKINSVIQAAWAHDASALALALQSEPATQAEIEAFPDYPPSQVKVAAQEPPPRDPQQEVDLLLGRAAAPSGELPPLPEPIAKVCEGRFNRTRWISSAPLNIQDLPVGPLFTADQMRAYGKACRSGGA